MNPHTARAVASIAAGTSCAGIAWAAPQMAVFSVIGILGTIYFIWDDAP